MTLYQKLLLGSLSGAVLIAIVGYLSLSLQGDVEYDVLLWGLSSHDEVESAARMQGALLVSQAALQELIEEHHSLGVNPQDRVHVEQEILRAQQVLQKQFANFDHFLSEAQSATTRGRDHAKTILESVCEVIELSNPRLF